MSQHSHTDACSTGCASYLRFSRRRFMQAGAAGVATLLGMPIRELMAAGGATKVAGGATVATAENVILLWMSGGMSHIDTLDPKPGRPTAGEFKPIRTTASGLEISEILPLTAKQMKHAAVIRSIAGVEGEHMRASYHLQTSYRTSPQMVHPSFGAVVAHEKEPRTELPSFVSVGGRAMSSAYLGQQCEAYYIGAPGMPDPYLQLPAGLTEGRYQKRLELLRQYNQEHASRRSAAGAADAAIANAQSYDAAVNFMHSPALKAFELEHEKQAVRDAYGDSNFGRGCLLARRLVEHGVRFVQVHLGGFDTHNGNFVALRRLGLEMDPAIAALISDLAASGLLSKTVVLMMSEFGRTPRINDQAGRDHHPGVFSCMLAGGGIKPGTVIGESDSDGVRPKTRPVAVADIHQTVATALGIDTTKEMYTPLGRPMTLIEAGKPIQELLERRA